MRDLEISANTKTVNTPSVAQAHKNVQPLAAHEASMYRAIVARANWRRTERTLRMLSRSFVGTCQHLVLVIGKLFGDWVAT